MTYNYMFKHGVRGLVDLRLKVQNILITPAIVFGNPVIFLDIIVHTGRFKKRTDVMPLFSAVLVVYLSTGIHEDKKFALVVQKRNSPENIQNEFRVFHLWQDSIGETIISPEAAKWLPNETTWEMRTRLLPSDFFYSILHPYQIHWENVAQRWETYSTPALLPETTQKLLPETSQANESKALVLSPLPEHVGTKQTEGLIFHLSSQNGSPNLFRVKDPFSNVVVEDGEPDDDVDIGFIIQKELEDDLKVQFFEHLYDEGLLGGFKSFSFSDVKVHPLVQIGQSAKDKIEQIPELSELVFDEDEPIVDLEVESEPFLEVDYEESSSIGLDYEEDEELIDYLEFCDDQDEGRDMRIEPYAVEVSSGEILSVDPLEDFYENAGPDIVYPKQFVPVHEEYAPLFIQKPFTVEKNINLKSGSKTKELNEANLPSSFCITPFPEQVFFFRKFQGKVPIQDDQLPGVNEAYFGRLIYLRNPFYLNWPHSQEQVYELLVNETDERFLDQLVAYEEAEIEGQVPSDLAINDYSELAEFFFQTTGFTLNDSAVEEIDTLYSLTQDFFNTDSEIPLAPQGTTSLEYYLNFLFNKSKLADPVNFSFEFDQYGDFLEEDYGHSLELRESIDEQFLENSNFYRSNWHGLLTNPPGSLPNPVLFKSKFIVNKNFAISPPSPQKIGDPDNDQNIIFSSGPLRVLKKEEPEKDQDIDDEVPEEEVLSPFGNPAFKRIRCNNHLFVLPKNEKAQYFLSSRQAPKWQYNPEFDEIISDEDLSLEELFALDLQEFTSSSSLKRDFTLPELYKMRKVKHKIGKVLQNAYVPKEKVIEGLTKTFEEFKNESYPYENSEAHLKQTLFEFIESYVRDPKTAKRQSEESLDAYYKPLSQPSSWAAQFYQTDQVNNVDNGLTQTTTQVSIDSHSNEESKEVKNLLSPTNSAQENTTCSVQLPVTRKYFLTERLFFEPIEPWPYFVAYFIFLATTPFYLPITRLITSIARFVKKIERHPFASLSARSTIQIFYPFQRVPNFTHLYFLSIDLNYFLTYFKGYKDFAKTRNLIRLASFGSILASSFSGASFQVVAVAAFTFVMTYQTQHAGAFPYAFVLPKIFKVLSEPQKILDFFSDPKQRFQDFKKKVRQRDFDLGLRYPLPTSFLVIGSSGTGKTLFFEALATYLGVIGVTCRVLTFRDVLEVMSLSIFRPCIYHFDHIENISVVREPKPHQRFFKKFVDKSIKTPNKPYQIDTYQTSDAPSRYLYLLQISRLLYLDAKLRVPDGSFLSGTTQNFRRIVSLIDKKYPRFCVKDPDDDMSLRAAELEERINVVVQKAWDSIVPPPKTRDISFPKRYQPILEKLGLIDEFGKKRYSIATRMIELAEARQLEKINAEVPLWGVRPPIETRSYDYAAIDETLHDEFHSMLSLPLGVSYDENSFLEESWTKGLRPLENTQQIFVRKQIVRRSPGDPFDSFRETVIKRRPKVRGRVSQSPAWEKVKEQINRKPFTQKKIDSKLFAQVRFFDLRQRPIQKKQKTKPQTNREPRRSSGLMVLMPKYGSAISDINISFFGPKVNKVLTSIKKMAIRLEVCILKYMVIYANNVIFNSAVGIELRKIAKRLKGKDPFIQKERLIGTPNGSISRLLSPSFKNVPKPKPQPIQDFCIKFNRQLNSLYPNPTVDKFMEYAIVQKPLVSTNILFEAFSTLQTNFPHYLRSRRLLCELLSEKPILKQPPVRKLLKKKAKKDFNIPNSFVTAESFFVDPDETKGMSTETIKLNEGERYEEEALLALLTALDGAIDSTIILASVRSLNLLDPALIRSGRFDNQIRLQFPHSIDRIQILKLQGRNHPFCNFSPDISWDFFANLTAGWNPADLGSITNQSLLYAYFINLPETFPFDSSRPIRKFIQEERESIFENLSETEKKSMKKLDYVQHLYARYPSHTMSTLVLAFLMRFQTRENIKKHFTRLENPRKF